MDADNTKAEEEQVHSFAKLNSPSTSYNDFVAVFGGVVEHCPFIAFSLWHQRPFSSPRAMHHALVQTLSQLPELAQAGIVCCYPDLAGKLAQEGRLMTDSAKEHKAAGLFDLTESERQEMSHLNRTYKNKFGMPFVICARENKKQKILQGLRERLNNSFAEEVKNSIEQVGKIAWYRILERSTPLSVLWGLSVEDNVAN